MRRTTGALRRRSRDETPEPGDPDRPGGAAVPGPAAVRENLVEAHHEPAGGPARDRRPARATVDVDGRAGRPSSSPRPSAWPSPRRVGGRPRHWLSSSLQSARGAQLLGPARRQVHRAEELGRRGADEGRDPKQRIGREPVAAGIVEPLDRDDQADATLLEEFGLRQLAAAAYCRQTMPTSPRLARMNRCRAPRRWSSRQPQLVIGRIAEAAPDGSASRASRPASISRCSATTSAA